MVALYMALVLLRRTLLTPHIAPTAVTAIWPASALLGAGLLLIPPRQQRIALLACAASVVALSTLLGGVTRPVLGTLEGIACAYLARRLCGPQPNFSNAWTLLVFLVGAVAPIHLVSAVAFYLMSNGLGEQALGLATAVQWFVGHALGAAIFIPAMLTLAEARRFRSVRRPPWELALSLATVTALSAMLFVNRWIDGLFLIFPALVALAFRYGPVGSSAGALIITTLGLVSIYGAPGQGPVLREVLWLQSFVAVVFLASLPTAGAVASFARTRSLLARRTLNARAARRRADAAGAAKTAFLANMSHEIRTPLNGVIGLADTLSRTELAPHQREMLTMILSSGEALTGLLSDALDLARADSGELKLTPAPYDVREAVSAAAFLFESIAREKGLAFAVRFDLDPPGGALGDALRIKQIVGNLISNAVKFTSEGSVSVEVSLKRRSADLGVLRVVVRDTGPEVKAKLFGRFEQGDSSVTRRFGGAGLGLSIVQRLATAMGGRIDCEAVPGRGAAFTFETPTALAEPVAEPAPAPLAAPETGAGAGLSVLLAEDNPVNQKVVQAMLGAVAELTVVADGRQAVDAVRARRFDVILMDVHMPVMDGLTAIRLIRADERRVGAGSIPIVTLTADAMPHQVQAALAAGADLHLAKPITAERLLGALGQCLGRARDRDGTAAGAAR